MIEHLFLAGRQLPEWVVVPVVYFIWVSALFLIKGLLFKVLRRSAGETLPHWAGQLIPAVEFPLLLLIFVSGGVIIGWLLPADSGLAVYSLLGFKATVIITGVIFIDRFFDGLLRAYSPGTGVFHSADGIIRDVTRTLVIGLGLLIFLDNFGISVTPVVASLGIGSLVIALGLRPIIEDFFAGVQLMIDKPIKEGDFIRLESGEEGWVHRIGWRSTRLRLKADLMVIIPNKVLSDSRVTNYYYPDKESALLVELGVHYGSDLERVEKITLDIAAEALQEVPGGVQAFQPFIRYHTFNAFRIDLTVFLRIKDHTMSNAFRFEFLKRLHQRYAREGLVVSYPIVAVNEKQEE